MRRNFLVAVAAISCSLAAGAQPTYKPVNVQAAESFRRELRSIVDDNTKALREALPNRQHAARLTAARKKSEQLFGDVFNPTFGSCVKAANLLETLWTDQAMIAANGGSAISIGGMSTRWFAAGAEYFSCRTAIDALTPSVPADCLIVYDLSKPSAPEMPRPEHCKKS